MSSLTQFGHSSSGLVSQKLRDIDAAAPRARLPPRALPDCVRRNLRLSPREGAPKARRNWEVPPEITTREALFGGAEACAQSRRRPSEHYGDAGADRRKVGAVVEVSRVPRNEAARRKSKAGKFTSPYDAEIKNKTSTRTVGRMERIPSSSSDVQNRMVFYD